MIELISMALFSALVIHGLTGENGIVNHFFPGWTETIGTNKKEVNK